MTDYATLTYQGRDYRLPVVEGSEGERAVDISSLRRQTGLITLDPGFGNTGSCRSAITFVDGERGILRYRGIPVEQLAEQSTFKETAYLLINGALPDRRELTRFSVLLNDHSLVHEDMKAFYQNFPRSSHPMGILSAMVNALRSFYPELQDLEEETTVTVTRLLSKVRTMAAMSYKISRGHTVVYPRPDLTYCANFLNMMFDSPVKPYALDPDVVKALNVFLILHADHEQNCSTAAVRVVGSARVNLYAAISAGIAALWGPLHGGANQAVIEMLDDIARSRNLPQVVARAKDRADSFRLMGFGHRVYKTYDPRAAIMRRTAHRLLEKLKIVGPAAGRRPRARGDRPEGRLLHRAPPVPERRFLQRHRPAGDRHPAEHVHGDVRDRPPAGLDRAVEGKPGRPGLEALPPAPGVRGADGEALRAAGREIGRSGQGSEFRVRGNKTTCGASLPEP